MGKINISNIAWAISEKIIQITLAMVFTGLVARYFGVELFGAYQFSTSVLFVATSLTWLCPAEMFYARLDNNGTLSESTIVTSIYYRFAISFLVFIGAILYIYLRIDDRNQKVFVLILSASLLYSEPLGIYRFIIEAQGNYRYTARLRLIGIIIKLLLVYLLIYFQVSKLLIITPIIIEGVFIAVGCFMIFKIQGGNTTLNVKYIDTALVRDFFREGFRYWIGLVAMSLFLRVDRFYLEAQLSNLDFGIYSAAMSILEQFTSISAMLIAVFAPIAVYRCPIEKLPNRLLLFSVLMVSSSIFGSIILSYFSSDLIRLLYGKQFMKASEILSFSVVFAPLIYLDATLSTLLLRKKATNIFAMKWLLALFVSYGINYFCFLDLGWKAGVFGYGIGWVASLIVVLIYTLIFYKSSVRTD